MEERGPLTELLIVEHGKMRELLARFIRASEREGNEKNKAYNLFKKKEKSHVFIEENEIFNFDKTLKIPIKKTLILQHIEAGKMLEKILEMMNAKKNPEELALELQEFLGKHMDLEEKEFYPLLDQQIPNNKKEELIKKITKLFGTELGQ